MKTIIVPTDYSKSANNAVEFAAILAHKMGAKIVLYHAFYLPAMTLELPVEAHSISELATENLAKLEAIKQEIIRSFHVEVACLTDSMPVVDYLNELVVQQQADMVVMGMNSPASFNNRESGSTTVSVIRQAKFPVLAIPEESNFHSLSHIMLAYDYKAIPPNHTLQLLKELALAFHAQVQVLHIQKSEPAASGKSTAMKGLPYTESILEGIKHEYIFMEEDDVIEGIEKGLKQYRPDLLVMIPREHGFWDMIFNKGITRKMAIHTHIPLLTLPNLLHH